MSKLETVSFYSRRWHSKSSKKKDFHGDSCHIIDITLRPWWNQHLHPFFWVRTHFVRTMRLRFWVRNNKRIINLLFWNNGWVRTNSAKGKFIWFLLKKESTCAFIFSCRILIIMIYVLDKLRRLCINKNMIYRYCEFTDIRCRRHCTKNEVFH